MLLKYKNIFFLTLLFPFWLYPSGQSFAQDLGFKKLNSSNLLNASITRENFTEFPDSIVIQDNHGKLQLDPLFFSTFNISNISNENITNSDIYLSTKEKGQIESNSYENNNFNESKKTSGIYNINLSNAKIQNVQVENNILSDKNNAEETNFSAENSRYLVTQARSLVAKGLNSQAEFLLYRALNNSQMNSWELGEVASIFEQIRRYDKAEQVYNKAISLNPNRIELLYSYALCLCRSNQLNKAEKTLIKIISINSDFMLAYYNLGNIYYRKGEYFKALNAFNNALKLNPLCADTYYNIALTLEVLNYKNLAKTYFQKCLQLRPNDKQAKKELKQLTKIYKYRRYNKRS